MPIVEAVRSLSRPAGDNEMREARHQLLQAFRHCQVVEAAKFVGENISSAPGKLENVIELARAKVGVDLVGDGADQFQREERHGKLDAVRQLRR